MKKVLRAPHCRNEFAVTLERKKQLQSSTCFGQIMNELIALDVMNYHDENRSQTHSLAAPAYSTKDTKKYLKFSLDIRICLFNCESGHSKMRPSFLWSYIIIFLQQTRIQTFPSVVCRRGRSSQGMCLWAILSWQFNTSRAIKKFHYLSKTCEYF